MTEQTSEPPTETHWLRRPATIRRLWWALFTILALTVIAEFSIHHHTVFGIDGSFGFNAWYGFATCVAMVLGAKLLGFVIKRRDNYYDPHTRQTESAARGDDD